jgi:predicted secreted Zn-dependent protease
MIDMKCSQDQLEDSEEIICDQKLIPFSGKCSNNGPIGGSFAETRVLCDPTSISKITQTEADGQICVQIVNESVNVSSKTELTMPDWKNKPEKCASMWDNFICKLREHEKEHHKMGVQTCSDMGSAIQAIVVESCASTHEAAQKQALSDYRREFQNAIGLSMRIGQDIQDEFDSDTNHGNLMLDCSCAN